MGEHTFWKQFLWTGLSELRESSGNVIDLKTKSTKTQEIIS